MTMTDVFRFDGLLSILFSSACLIVCCCSFCFFQCFYLFLFVFVIGFFCVFFKTSRNIIMHDLLSVCSVAKLSDLFVKQYGTFYLDDAANSVEIKLKRPLSQDLDPIPVSISVQLKIPETRFPINTYNC